MTCRPGVLSRRLERDDGRAPSPRAGRKGRRRLPPGPWGDGRGSSSPRAAVCARAPSPPAGTSVGEGRRSTAARGGSLKGHRSDTQQRRRWHFFWDEFAEFTVLVRVQSLRPVCTAAAFTSTGTHRGTLKDLIPTFGDTCSHPPGLPVRERGSGRGRLPLPGGVVTKRSWAASGQGGRCPRTPSSQVHGARSGEASGHGHMARCRRRRQEWPWAGWA